MPFTLTMPKLSPTMEKGVIVKWHKNAGDFVAAGEVLLEISTDKATVEHSALDEGWLRKIIVTDGGEATVNQSIALFTETEQEPIEDSVLQGATGQDKDESTAEKKANEPSEPYVKEPSAPQVKDTAKKRILASPLAKKLALEQGLDLAYIAGTGPGGRIMKKDLAAGRKETEGDRKVIREGLPQAGSYEEIALSPIRQVIAQRLKDAKASIPHFYVQQAVDAENLFAIREQLNRHEVKLTFNDLILKATALALRQHPTVNCGFNAASNRLIMYKTIDISVAVSIDEGLITPIVTNADYKSLPQLSAEVKELSKKAKEGKLQPHEFQGGSFTISNLGMYGVSDFQAIINPPQAAILAVSAIKDQPVVKNGVVVPGKMLNLSLSVDHRAIDGALAALFMRTLQQLLEAPAILLL